MRASSDIPFLLHRMIAIFDEDGGGDVDFQEFVSGLSAFSSKGNKEEKLRFAFKVYDIDRDGYISNGELFIVLKMMVGSNLKDQQLQQVRFALAVIFLMQTEMRIVAADTRDLLDRSSIRQLWRPIKIVMGKSALRNLLKWSRILMCL